MNKGRSQVELLLDDIESIRQATIASKKADTPELRSLMRTTVQRIEAIQATPQVPQAAYNAVASMLSQLIDAEHRLLLQHLAAGGDVPPSLTRHIDARRHQLESSEQTINSMRSLIERACVLLNAAAAPKRNTELKDLCRLFEQTLREHLHDNAALRQEVAQLIRAMQASVQNMNGLLEEIGDEPGGMSDIEQMLQEEFPDDPKQAQALLQKTRQALLAAANKMTNMRGSLHQAMQSQISSIEALSQRLRHAEEQANKDALTGLANRRQLGQFMSALEEGEAALLMVDIDHFKKINDRHGHIAGDKILTAAAELLAGLVRTTDIAARFGGEEFCIVMPDIDLDQAHEKAEHIRSQIAGTPFESGDGLVSITASIGVACRRDGESIPHWTKRADAALYKAKQQGRNSVVSGD